MTRSSGALKILPSPKGENANATNCNDDKARISQLKEALTKLMRDPKMVKKAAHIIEEMLHSSPQMPNK